MLAFAVRHIGTGDTETVRLMVADDNPALALYERLGFVDWGAPPGSIWSEDPTPDEGHRLMVAAAVVLEFQCLASVLEPLDSGELPQPPSMVAAAMVGRSMTVNPRGGPRGNQHRLGRAAATVVAEAAGDAGGGGSGAGVRSASAGDGSSNTGTGGSSSSVVDSASRAEGVTAGVSPGSAGVVGSGAGDADIEAGSGSAAGGADSGAASGAGMVGMQQARKRRKRSGAGGHGRKSTKVVDTSTGVV